MRAAAGSSSSSAIIARRRRSSTGSNGSSTLKRAILRQLHFEPFIQVAELLRVNDQVAAQNYIQGDNFEMLTIEDVDFFVPQICVLLVAYPSKEGDGLRTLVLNRCAQSLHCAMKYVWYFSSMADYSSSPMKERCQDFSRLCEVAVVNSSLPDTTPPMSPRSRDTVSPVSSAPSPGVLVTESDDILIPLPESRTISDEIKEPAKDVDILSTSQLEKEMKSRLGTHKKEPLLVATNGRDLREDLAAVLDQVGPESAPISRKNSNDVFNRSTNDMLDPLEENNGSNVLVRSHSATSVLTPKDNTEKDARKSVRSQTDSAPIQPHSKEFAMFLAKQKRSELFTAQLDMFLQLEIISRKLKKQPRDVRKDMLRKYLTVLDFKITAQNLYIPNCRASDPHHRILRFVSEEGVTLSSREKVPYLVHLEVVYTGKTCSDSDIYEDSSDDESGVEEDLKESPTKSDSRAKLERLKARRVSSSNKLKFKSQSKLGRPFGELLIERKERIRKRSPHGKLDKWDLRSVIVKVGEDCRQEALAMQMISHINDIFKDARLPLKLRPFHVLITSPITGLIEVVTDTTSVDSLKRNVKNFQSLIWFFENHFGPRGSKEFLAAQNNFVQSIAAYSLITYLLQIKDRHNGNILLDAEGHIVHIDFGFFLSNSPGGNWGFEQAPFKLTQEYVEVMEGEDSDCFNNFKLYMIRGFLELRRHADKLVSLASILLKGPTMPCFYTGVDAITQLKARFYADKSEQDCIQCVYALIEESVNNWRSVEYDRYQRITNGIL